MADPRLTPRFMLDVECAIFFGGAVESSFDGHPVWIVSDVAELEGVANGLDPLPRSPMLLRDDGRHVKVFRRDDDGRAA